MRISTRTQYWTLGIIIAICFIFVMVDIASSNPGAPLDASLESTVDRPIDTAVIGGPIFETGGPKDMLTTEQPQPRMSPQELDEFEAWMRDHFPAEKVDREMRFLRGTNN